jgi:cytochrome bd ubiquinol oxidase subunit I
MDSALAVHRLHFAFTATFHYLFPQLTMGLALLIFVLKVMALRSGNEVYGRGARFWTKIFAVNFLMGVVTGIPLEFQFGTNWSEFSRAAGGVIGQTLAMEGTFAFFLESTFLGLFLFGEKKLGPRLHTLAAFMVFAGSWLSGYFIVVTDAFMQHPVGHGVESGGKIVLESIGALLLNPWGLWEYAHTMAGSVVTAAFAMAATGAFYLLHGRHVSYGKLFVRIGVVAGAVAAVLQVFPTGDGQGRQVARHQPVTLAAMEGLFRTEAGAPLVLLGQPDMEKQRLDNPLVLPNMLSFLTYQRWNAEIKGLEAFPRESWPDNIPLIYYAYHIMVGLGTIFVAIALLAAWKLLRGTLYGSRAALWVLMLAFPFPFIANTAGWITAEVGRQPWVIYGLVRTADGYSKSVSAGNAVFTLIGFAGMYTLLGILAMFLVGREIAHGPEPAGASADGPPAA